VRFRRSSTDRIVRSRQAAHPAIVSVDTLYPGSAASPIKIGRRAPHRVQTGTQRPCHHTALPPPRAAAVFGMPPCKMKVSPRSHGIYLPLPRTLAPHSPLLTQHLATVYVREKAICAPLAPQGRGTRVAANRLAVSFGHAERRNWSPASSRQAVISPLVSWVRGARREEHHHGDHPCPAVEVDTSSLGGSSSPRFGPGATAPGHRWRGPGEERVSGGR
jgi:hypothetical protein